MRWFVDNSHPLAEGRLWPGGDLARLKGPVHPYPCQNLGRCSLRLTDRRRFAVTVDMCDREGRSKRTKCEYVGPRGTAPFARHQTQSRQFKVVEHMGFRSPEPAYEIPLTPDSAILVLCIKARIPASSDSTAVPKRCSGIEVSQCWVRYLD